MVIKGEKRQEAPLKSPCRLSRGVITSGVDVFKSLDPGLAFPLVNKRAALVYNLPTSRTAG